MLCVYPPYKLVESVTLIFEYDTGHENYFNRRKCLIIDQLPSPEEVGQLKPNVHNERTVPANSKAPDYECPD